MGQNATIYMIQKDRKMKGYATIYMNQDDRKMKGYTVQYHRFFHTNKLSTAG